MPTTPGTPSIIWHNQPKIHEAVEDSTKKSQTGCAYCLFEGTHAPLEVVYYWGGTSICQGHLLKLRDNQQ